MKKVTIQRDDIFQRKNVFIGLGDSVFAQCFSTAFANTPIKSPLINS